MNHKVRYSFYVKNKQSITLENIIRDINNYNIYFQRFILHNKFTMLQTFMLSK